MWRRSALVFALYVIHGVCLACVSSAPASAETRMALIIGNSAYSRAPLANAARDAKLVADQMKKLNFEVFAHYDLSLKEMKRAIQDFAAAVRARGKESVAFIYYAGHGVQANGDNYLIPVDENIRSEGDVDIDSVSVSSLMSMLDHVETAVNIVVFDACRVNPFGYARAALRGLARVDAPRGSLVAFATSPGASAEDGANGHSPYAAALAQALAEPGLRIEEVFKKVRIAVLSATGGKQTPWESTSLTGEFYPAGRLENAGSPVTASPPPPAAARGPSDAGAEKGRSFRDCANCPEMIGIPAGRFIMGSPKDEREHRDNEAPQHEVTIPKPLAVGKFTVTFAEWDACVADGGCGGHRPWDLGWGHGERPVIHVNWHDAQAYVTWLRLKTGKAYRLLSEAEWEYAARAGTTTPFWWGASISTTQANYNGGIAYGDSGKGQNRAATVPVESFDPNPWGLYQMHGNVWEWVEDCYHGGYDGAPSDGSPWVGGLCLLHVMRGGSWFDAPALLRSAQRLGWGLRMGNVGFRVARPLDPDDH